MFRAHLNRFHDLLDLLGISKTGLDQNDLLGPFLPRIFRVGFSLLQQVLKHLAVILVKH
jgi:hypothetical protein